MSLTTPIEVKEDTPEPGLKVKIETEPRKSNAYITLRHGKALRDRKTSADVKNEETDFKPTSTIPDHYEPELYLTSYTSASAYSESVGSLTPIKRERTSSPGSPPHKRITVQASPVRSEFDLNEPEARPSENESVSPEPSSATNNTQPALVGKILDRKHGESYYRYNSRVFQQRLGELPNELRPVCGKNASHYQPLHNLLKMVQQYWTDAQEQVKKKSKQLRDQNNKFNDLKRENKQRLAIENSAAIEEIKLLRTHVKAALSEKQNLKSAFEVRELEVARLSTHVADLNTLNGDSRKRISHLREQFELMEYHTQEVKDCAHKLESQFEKVTSELEEIRPLSKKYIKLEEENKSLAQMASKWKSLQEMMKPLADPSTL